MAESDLLRVTRIRVTKLFGRYDHDVVLNSRDRVTIVHGPNGVGKTTVLRLTAAALSGDLGQLLKVPFQAFEVVLSDGAVLGFKKSEGSRDGDDEMITSYLVRGGSREEAQLRAGPFNPRILARDMPWRRRLDADRFVDRRSEEIVSAEEVLSRYADLFPQELRRSGTLPRLPKWMSAIHERVGAHLIEAQRLLRLRDGSKEWEYRRQPEAFVATVRTYANDLRDRIARALTQYAETSQTLDQTFPQRLFQSSVPPLSADELKRRMRDLENQRDQLKRIGLIDDDPNYPFDATALEALDETRRTVMTLYVNDTGLKLGVLDDLARRIEILLDHINRKFQHKAIHVDREKGLKSRTSDGAPLDLDGLSSGEQHELVLLYDLLFRVKPNTVVLIDEPELSLHVTWQKTFLTDLLEVVETTGFDVILATYSPFIVGGRQDLMVALSADGAETERELQLVS